MKNLTYKTFVDFVNQEFKRLEINDFEAYKAERTYHRRGDYEAGACKMLVWFKPTGEDEDKVKIKHYFMCFYFLKEYNEYRKKGYTLYLKFGNNSRFKLIKEVEVEVRY